MIGQYINRVAARHSRKIYSAYLCGKNMTCVTLRASRRQGAARGDTKRNYCLRIIQQTEED